MRADAPAPQDVRSARLKCGLTQEAAAALIGLQRLAWARYEAGAREMQPALWVLWRHLAGIERIPFRRRHSRRMNKVAPG